MTDQKLESLLSQKEASPARANVPVVLSPQITRNALRLKKRWHDRRQALLCVLIALLFVLVAGGAAFYILVLSPDRAAALHKAAVGAGVCMGLTLLLAPALAYFSDEERTKEA